MASYNIAKEITIRRQAGDTFDIRILVPDLLDITGATARFVVKNNIGNAILSKTTADAGIVITGQEVYMRFEPEESHGKALIARWELEVTVDGNVYTIGKGVFELIKELQ